MTVLNIGAAPATTPDYKWPEGGMTKIPNWVYSDPHIYKKELDVFYYGDTWHYIGLACEVPEVGSFRRSSIGERPVILVRSGENEFSVLENRCAHKGAQLCWENTGKVSDFTCPYHQWNYSLKGDLQGVPFLRGALGKGGMPRDFKKSEYGLRSLRMHYEGGSIWATFSDKTPSFEDYCGPDVLREVRHMLPGKPLVLLGYTRQLIPSNWKTYLENLKDPYHATLLHSFYITFGLWRADNKSECVPQERGHSVMISHNEGKKKSDATSQMKRFRDDLQVLDKETVTPRKEFNNKRVGGGWIFPSAYMGIQANTLKMRHLIPKGPNMHELVFTHYGFEDDDEELRRLRLKHANLLGPSGFVSMDDSEMLSQVQHGVKAYPHEVSTVEMGGKDIAPTDYMVSEVLIRSFYKFYREAMDL